MTAWTLIRRSLCFHARAHLGVVLGAAIGSAALIGALIVGDSVRATLRQRALQGLANAWFALAPGDRFFTQQLKSRAFKGQVDSTAMLLALPGTTTASASSARANHVQVFGVQEDFWNLAGITNYPRPAGETVVLNQALAAGIGARVGDEVIVRVQRPSRMSREAAVMQREDQSLALRLRVAGILPSGSGGDLNLKAGAAPAMNAFVDLDMLSSRTELTNKANLWLAGLVPEAKGSTAERIRFLQQQVQKSWTLEDASLRLAPTPNPAGIELRSSRVFLEPPVAAAAARIPASNTVPILTYLANLLAKGSNATPYSMVTSAGPPYTAPEMHDDEIVLTQWLAEDLGAKTGDRIELSYFLPDSGAKLAEGTNRFRVHSIVPLEGVYADRTLMPDFPGLDKAESTRDWDAAFPLVYKIRPKDEQYWKERRGMPKAYITLAAGQKMWANRFGTLTAIRFPDPPGRAIAAHSSQISSSLLATMKPEEIGLSFEPIRERALKAAEEAQDFGQLFLGFSFFLIFAALALMAMLFQFGLEQRTAEVGTMLALGFRPGQVRRLLLGEGAALAFLGGIIGALGGLAYARAMLWGLSTVWRNAVGGSSLMFHVSSLTIVLGVCAGTVMSVLAIWLTLRKQTRQPARELLAGEIQSPRRSPGKPGISARPWALWIGLASGAGAISMVGWASFKEEASKPETFFSAGALALVGGLAAAAAWFSALARRTPSDGLTLAGLGVRGCARRRKRSLATAGMLASGCFLIVAVAAFQLDANQQALSRSSGTGGFALLGESALPIVQDLNSPRGREFFGLSADDLQGVGFVPFRVREGDDASCLNLNRAQRPRLLGVRPEAMTGRFTFAAVAKGLDSRMGWQLLDASRSSGRTPTDEIPAIGDANSIQWALGKKIGDTLDYTDEQGRAFKLRLVGAVANSILQGSLIIDEAEFISRFPSESGYRMFLIDAPPASVPQFSATLSRSMQDVGMELTPTVQRLNAFNAVQNTYLGTFRILGGLGLLLGSAGLGIVVLRNVLERRGELGLLVAIGFRRRTLQQLVLSEHGALLGLGLIIGIVAAVVAVLPSLVAAGARLPYASLGLTLGAVLCNGAIWTWLATRFALRGDLLKALRNE